MLILTLSILFAALFASLPFWLPSAVLGLRIRIFTWINGAEGVAIPGKLVDAAQFRRLYSHPAANGRSRGAALSDLFWYWLSPGAELHQEHLEPGENYDEVARTTRRILGSISKKSAEELAATCVARAIERQGISPRLVRLRDLMMPIWAEFYYTLVFGRGCPALARDLIVGNADDVVTALKCCSLRHMGRRYRLTRYLIEQVELGTVPQPLPAHLSTRQQALYLQGTFFNTAVVQMSEAMVHLLLALAQHPQAQDRAATEGGDGDYLDQVIDESLRLYPLFGIAHRITTAEIDLDERTQLPPGSVLCFNYPTYHRLGFDDPGIFDPDRWRNCVRRDANYIPFGVTANRPCPAQGLAPITMKIAARAILRQYTLHSSASHTRSIPNRGPCLMVPRSQPLGRRARQAQLLGMRARDRWEDVWRSIVQLILGTYMVWDARRLRLCQRYFEAVDPSPQGAEESLRPLGGQRLEHSAERCPRAQ